MALNERSLEEIAEHVRAGRLSIAASMLAEAAPNRYLAGQALARLSHASNLSSPEVEQLLAKLQRYGVNVRPSDVPSVLPGPPTVAMPPGWQDLETLGYITPVANLRSIEEKGILSFNRARQIQHVSIADPQIQERRHRRPIRGRDLHDYVNLFINPRNAMLSRVISEQGVSNIAVVAVSAPAVFALPDVLVTVRNAAARSYVEPWPGIRGLQSLDRDIVFTDSWYRQGKEDRDLKQRMMAEVLVPDTVPASLLTAIAVASSDAARRLKLLPIRLPVLIDRQLFFS